MSVEAVHRSAPMVNAVHGATGFVPVSGTYTCLPQHGTRGRSSRTPVPVGCRAVQRFVARAGRFHAAGLTGSLRLAGG